MDKNEVRKELMKSKSLASFHHYTAGNMYYTVSILGVIYQFPIPTLDRITYGDEETAYRDTFYLSEDLGTTSFFRDIKAFELNRWIGKAIDNKEFIKISG